MKTILVVEDDMIHAQVLHDFLTAHGYFVSVARNGQEGVNLFFEEHPSMVITDVALPRKSGFELCFDIRNHPEGRDTPLILISAVYTDLEHAEQYAMEGLTAQGYLAKPLDLYDLLTRVHTLIGEA